jgi:hypothetical protein
MKDAVFVFVVTYQKMVNFAGCLENIVKLRFDVGKMRLI